MLTRMRSALCNASAFREASSTTLLHSHGKRARHVMGFCFLWRMGRCRLAALHPAAQGPVITRAQHQKVGPSLAVSVEHYTSSTKSLGLRFLQFNLPLEWKVPGHAVRTLGLLLTSQLIYHAFS